MTVLISTIALCENRQTFRDNKKYGIEELVEFNFELRINRTKMQIKPSG